MESGLSRLYYPWGKSHLNTQTLFHVQFKNVIRKYSADGTWPLLHHITSFPLIYVGGAFNLQDHDHISGVIKHIWHANAFWDLVINISNSTYTYLDNRVNTPKHPQIGSIYYILTLWG